MSELPKYENRIVAFIDILGFTNLISTLKDETDLHRKLYRALSFIHSYKNNTHNNDTIQSGLDISVFSDSIVISSSVNNLSSIIWTCGQLQAELLYLGILSRGGISEGLTVHENDILYGDGMIKAYNIESKVAIYPRVVVDESVCKHAPKKVIEFFLKKADDGLLYINQFVFDAMCDGASDLAADGYDPRLLYFEEVEIQIEKNLVNANQLAHKQKWSWLKNEFNEAYNIYKLTCETLFQKLERTAITK